MSMLTIFDIGRTSLVAQRQALEVTGENISNVNTPGYSRQTAIMETAPVSLDKGFPLGNGVNVAQIRRSYDEFIETQLKAENSNYGNQTTLQSSLQRVDQLFNEMNADGGMAKSLQDFFNSWQDLAMNPQGLPERQAVLARSQVVVDNFHRMNTFLDNIKTESNQSLTAIASEVNDKAAQIATLNDQIKEIELFGQPANEIRDRRDLMIKDLSKVVGINTLEQADGTVTVTLLQGPQLVEGGKSGKLTLQANADNKGYYDIMLTLPADKTPINVTSIIGGSGNKSGSIGATMQLRDKVINTFQSGLDELAYTVANQVNMIHTTGFGLNGSTGNYFFNQPASQAGYSSLINVNITKSADVAAASTNPALAGNGTGNNIIALKLADLKNASFSLSSGSTTIQGFFSGMVGQVGVATQNAQRGTKQSDAVLKQLDNLRESVSGVSLDEELANLIKYQKAFEGAAKLINTGTEMMDTILGLIR